MYLFCIRNPFHNVCQVDPVPISYLLLPSSGKIVLLPLWNPSGLRWLMGKSRSSSRWKVRSLISGSLTPNVKVSLGKRWWCASSFINSFCTSNLSTFKLIAIVTRLTVVNIEFSSDCCAKISLKCKCSIFLNVATSLWGIFPHVWVWGAA